MHSTKEHISKLFQSRRLFEKEVLNVQTDKDRAEIVHILAQTFVQDDLKEHLNFVYIRKLEDFSLSQIVNILFREIANEWIDYAKYELEYSKDDALEALRFKERVSFIRSLSSDYYKHFKEYIFAEIADTFLELLESNSDIDKHSILINSVINSDFIPNRSVLNINSSDQLCKAVKTARDLKNTDLKYLQDKIQEIQAGILNQDITLSKREDLNIVLPSYEQKLQEVLGLKLEYYDNNLKRVKRALINSLKTKEN